jgi:hypothetical protein
MTQKRSRLPGRMPGATSARGTTDVYFGHLNENDQVNDLTVRTYPRKARR